MSRSISRLLLASAFAVLAGCGTTVTDTPAVGRVTPTLRNACVGLSDAQIAATIAWADSAKRDGWSYGTMVDGANDDCKNQCGSDGACVAECQTCLLNVLDSVY